MAIIPFKEWIPDAAALGNPGSPVITNAIPGLNSYLPFPSFSVITGALDARPRGAIEAIDNSGNVFNYAGDASKLYQLSGTTWSDVSKSGGYSTSDRWEFARWKSQVLATNFDDSPQKITFSGANFADLTTAFKARHIAVIREFVFFGNTTDSTDGEVRHRLRWSAFDDETDYTADPSTGADVRDLIVGGAIQAVVGGQYGVVVSERSTFRVTFSGAPTWFQIDEVLPGVGTIAPGSVVRLGDHVFFISEQGFVALTAGSSPAYPGSGKVDRFLRNDLDTDHLERVSAVADPKSGRIFWAYPGAGNTSGRPNKVIVYDVNLGRWGYAEDELELIWRQSGVATTLEELDDFSLGSELVSTGDFASDTNWTKGTGWTIGSGVATHAAGTASEISQDISAVEDTYYRVEFDVSGRTAGSVTPELGGTAGTAISADDTDIKETIRAGADGDIAFSATSDFDGSIDNVSVKEVTSIDDLGISLDSGQWKGGDPQLAAFDENFKSGSFTGSAMTGTFETKEVETHAGHRTHLNAFRPLVEGGSVTGQVGTRNRQTDEVTWSSVLTQSSSGRFTTRANARYHRFRLIAADDWDDAIGVQIEPSEARKAGKRG